jgi:hypothetical protein
MARKGAVIGPKQLGPAGRKLWRYVEEKFDLEGCEPLLMKICLIEDRLIEVRTSITERGLVMVDGKKNQLLTAETQLLAEFSKIWRLLGLADVPVEEKRSPGRPPESERIRR